MNNAAKNVVTSRHDTGAAKAGLRVRPGDSGGPPAPHVDQIEADPATVQRLRLSLQHELALARRMRAEAEDYRLQTEARARSDAQRLLLETRLSVKKEISKLESEASEQLKKLLVDIRMIRLAAQEELEAQRQFTSAAKIAALSNTVQDKTEKTPAYKRSARKNPKY